MEINGLAEIGKPFEKNLGIIVGVVVLNLRVKKQGEN